MNYLLKFVEPANFETVPIQNITPRASYLWFLKSTDMTFMSVTMTFLMNYLLKFVELHHSQEN